MKYYKILHKVRSENWQGTKEHKTNRVSCGQSEEEVINNLVKFYNSKIHYKYTVINILNIVPCSEKDYNEQLIRDNRVSELQKKQIMWATMLGNALMANK